MRIRSTKPEFWRSKTIAELPWDVRLVLKGLESYVDDNGVGKDDIALIAADVFPRDLSANPRDTLARLSEAISQLSQHQLIHRYVVDNENLLYVDRWKKQQRIDKPAKGRFPRPDGTFEYTEDVNRDSYANPRETVARPPEVLAPGTGEQGNRGTEDSATRAIEIAAPDNPQLAADEPNSQTLVAEWIDHCPGGRPPGNVIGQISKQIKQMLDTDHIPYADVRTGLARWQEKGLHPSALPSVVHEVRTAGPRRTNQQAATEDLLTAAMQRAIERDQAKEAS